MEFQQLAEKYPALQGTIFEEIFQTLDSGDFVEPETPVAEDEIVIDMMNQLEMTLWTLLERHTESLIKTHKRFIAVQLEAIEVSDEEKLELKKQLELGLLKKDFLRNMFWGNLETRLYPTKSVGDEECTGYGIRSGWSIVRMENERPCSPSGVSVIELRGGRSMLREILSDFGLEY